ncbi:MAG: PAS domain S-box protein [Candidatus Lindowbacteria bacterium]|nr:PAS domain S-box protein [Candidatus Lindowbacteria bacterium]
MASREVENSYRSIFNAANDAIFVHELATGDILDVNRKMCEMYGYSQDEARRLDVEALSAGTTPYTQSDALRWIRKAVEGEPQLFEWLAKDKGGRLFWVEVNLKRASIGGKDCLLAIVRDITERKQADVKLRRSEKRYRQLYESSRDGYVLVDTTDRIIESNSTFRKLLGYSKKELLEKTYKDITPRKWHRREKEIIERQVYTRGYSDIYEKEYRKKDGSVFPIEVRTYFTEDEHGNPAGMWAFVRDVTERKRVEAEIRRLNEDLERRVVERTLQLEAANKELEAFTFSASHDLRAPLKNMEGFAKLLVEEYSGMVDERGKRYLQHVLTSCEHMEQLIDALLNLSLVTRAEMVRGRVNLSELAGTIAASLQEAEPERKAEFVISQGLVTHGDARLLRIALENLLGNAWKFTSKRPLPRIEFGALPRRAAGKPGRTKRLVYFVRDNGAGFNMEYVDKLFGAFQRLHGSTQFPGTGIGLATVRRIIQRHGGRVWAEGETDKGATFYFEL